MQTPLHPTQRFSDRVEDYRRYRPHYPTEIVNLLARDCGLTPQTEIADIAAGTGLLAEIFLVHGNPVLAVEPNASMRAACASLTATYPQLICVDGSAEATDLPAHSVDMVTVGQAMHWFHLARARAEFARILRPNGWCVVVYNHRRKEEDDFHTGYERILSEFGADYRTIHGSHLHRDKLAQFFSPGQMMEAVLPSVQELTLEGLKGRILSSSYMPHAGHPQYPSMSRAIEDLFVRYQRHGHVRIEYDCAVSYGQLNSA